MDKNELTIGAGHDKTPIERLLSPFQEFLQRQTSGGILLLACTVLALVWANSPWSAGYFATWHTTVTIGIGKYVLSKQLHHWINDGLMAVFFFVVGLEIKREIIAGELTSLRKAMLPVAAAIGGMIFPAIIYTCFNWGGAGKAGWGIPMATDIAFSLCVLQLLGNRVPLSLKIFLTAFAIVDDIGAVLVIAVFYTSGISLPALLLSAVLLGLAVLLNVSGVRRPLAYYLVGLLLWVAILKSGVHATVAGVLLAMVIPARTRIAERQFLDDGQAIMEEFRNAGPLDVELGLNSDRHAVINKLQELAEGVQTPLHRLEDELHPWVTFLILPIFALANAGVNLSGTGITGLTHPVGLGIILGLVVGKFIGVTLFSWLAVWLRFAALPDGIRWVHVAGAAFLGGIGFTMSLFVGDLAFGESELLNIAKLGILVGSVVSSVIGCVILLGVGPAVAVRPALPAPLPDEEPPPISKLF